MTPPKALLAFLHDLIIGDDATIALAVTAGLALTAAAADLGLSAWWILPSAAVATLAISLKRATGTTHKRHGDNQSPARPPTATGARSEREPTP
jgi:hypothetical protein